MDKISAIEYQKLSERTSPLASSAIADRISTKTSIRTIHGIFGLITELGELTDVLKKYTFYGKPISEEDLVNLQEEIGDLMWYIAEICNANSWELDKIMYSNVEKLRKRFPDKFSEHHALNRDLASEVESLKNNL